MSDPRCSIWSEASPERLDQAARSLTYNGSQAEGAAKHLLFVAGHRIAYLLQILGDSAEQLSASRWQTDRLRDAVRQVRENSRTTFTDTVPSARVITVDADAFDGLMATDGAIESGLIGEIRKAGAIGGGDTAIGGES